MNTLFVSMFRHRQVNDLRCIDDKLVPILKELIRTKPYVSFFIGRNGEFDKYAASVIKRTQKEAELKNSDMTLVLPYSVADIEYYEKYYDSVIIPECVHGAHSKAAISLKNRWMVERSDLVIVYVERVGGGAYKAMKYAERLKKDVINICEWKE